MFHPLARYCIMFLICDVFILSERHFYFLYIGHKFPFLIWFTLGKKVKLCFTVDLIMIMLDMMVCVGGAVVCVGGAIWNNVHSHTITGHKGCRWLLYARKVQYAFNIRVHLNANSWKWWWWCKVKLDCGLKMFDAEMFTPMIGIWQTKHVLIIKSSEEMWVNVYNLFLYHSNTQNLTSCLWYLHSWS